jgi:hypothetical protein
LEMLYAALAPRISGEDSFGKSRKTEVGHALVNARAPNDKIELRYALIHLPSIVVVSLCCVVRG